MDQKVKYVICLVILSLAILYNENLMYYTVLSQCRWPTKFNDSVRAMILTDTHLLGPINGNWIERWRVEAEMRRAFQSSIWLHQPDVVFILGDLFDEGQYVDDEYFKEYLHRFYDIFKTPPHIKVYCLVGNHDVGFHYRLHANTSVRFAEAFSSSLDSLITIKNTHFVILNSMALFGDGCNFCSKTEAEIQHISKRLNCAKQDSDSDFCRNLTDKLPFYKRPILLQHYPTFRESDIDCLEHDYSELEIFRESWEVLSKNATEFVGDLLDPAVAICGHSHHHCRSINMWDKEEYTVASFSWQHKPSPSFVLAEFSEDQYAISKCDMPRQITYLITYIIMLILIILVLVYYKRKQL